MLSAFALGAAGISSEGVETRFMNHVAEFNINYGTQEEYAFRMNILYCSYHVLTNNHMVTLGCGNNIASLVYFLSFLVLISWLILNLSVAAVIEGLENAR